MRSDCFYLRYLLHIDIFNKWNYYSICGIYGRCFHAEAWHSRTDQQRRQDRVRDYDGVQGFAESFLDSPNQPDLQGTANNGKSRLDQPDLGLDSNLKDFMNHTWIGQNELTGVGLRQSFLVGYRDRLRYINEKGLISEIYDPRDILVYASENNRTLMSASSLLHGLFLPGTGPVINPNLVDRAVPPVDPAKYEEEKKELDDANCTALPGQMNLVPVHIFFSHEYFTQYETSKKCVGLKHMKKKIKKEKR